MRLPFENWLYNQNFSTEILTAFEEAVKCYKADANRASLLFTYIGWGLCLRQRLLNTTRTPTGVPAHKWAESQNNLRNDDKWDAEVFDATQRRTEPFFVVTEDLRRQVAFWKDRRNDCAHYKGNVDAVASAHVDAFWLFVQANLPKFVPNGSRADLVERIERHFDPNFTPPNQSSRALAEAVITAMRPDEIEEFLREVTSAVNRGTSGTTTSKTDELVTYFEELARLGRNEVNTALSRFLVGNEGLLVAFLRSSPQRVLLFANDAPLIRRLWRELLFADGLPVLPVYSALLRNTLIPQEQKDEANQFVADKITDEIPREEDFAVLSGEGFIEALLDNNLGKIEYNHFNIANTRKNVIVWLIEHVALTERTVRVICETFASGYHPWDVRDQLRGFFFRNPEKRSEFEAKAQELHITLPTRIFPPPRDLDLDDEESSAMTESDQPEATTDES